MMSVLVAAAGAMAEATISVFSYAVWSFNYAGAYRQYGLPRHAAMSCAYALLAQNEAGLLRLPTLAPIAVLLAILASTAFDLGVALRGCRHASAAAPEERRRALSSV